MKVIVASQNPIKIEAAKRAFTKMFPGETIDIESVSVASGVADQPMSTIETKQGAINRAHAAHEAVPDADFWVGQEGGLVDEGDSLRNVPWMCIINRNGTESSEHGASYTLPKPIEVLVRSGVELSQAGDQYFNETEIGKKGGVIQVLTKNSIDRTSYYEQALITSLIPFITHD